jgi:arginyl-tRNA synthetase
MYSSGGFINIWIPQNKLTQNLYKNQKIEKRDEKVIVEYSSPNIAKPLHIGNLVSTIVGDSIYRIYKYLGYDTVNENHLGDWGTQFGKLLYAVEHWGDSKKIEENKSEELLKLYIRFHKEEDNDDTLKDKGKIYFEKLQSGDKNLVKLWEDYRSWSIKEIEKIYKILDISFVNMHGESFYEDSSKEIIRDALKRKIAKKDKDGSVVIDTGEKVPLLIQKSDGTTLYSTRDLAALKYRCENMNKDIVIYEIGVEQKHAIEQMVKAATMLGYTKKAKIYLIFNGFVKLQNKEKLSTRKGNIITVEEVIKEVEKETKSIMEKRGISSKDIIESIAVGAIKFNILKKHYSKDTEFNWKTLLDFNGNTSTYLQYTWVRCKSLLNNITLKKENLIFNEEEEILLLRKLYHFNNAIDNAKLSPNTLAEYLLDIARLYNSIYQKYNILKENDPIRNSRLLLSYKTMETIKVGLSLLGINTVDKM